MPSIATTPYWTLIGGTAVWIFEREGPVVRTVACFPYDMTNVEATRPLARRAAVRRLTKLVSDHSGSGSTTGETGQ